LSRKFLDASEELSSFLIQDIKFTLRTLRDLIELFRVLYDNPLLKYS